MSRSLGPACNPEVPPFQMRVRPGGGATEVARRSSGTPFRFSMLPGQQADTKLLQDHLAFEAEHGGRVCILPELQAILEDNIPTCSERLLLVTEEDACQHSKDLQSVLVPEAAE